MAEEKEAVQESPFNSETRAQMLVKYAEESGAVPEEQKAEAPAEPTPDEKPEDKTAAEPEKAPAQDKPKEEKTVPYGALHEERILRQTEARLRKELEARTKALEEELARLRKTDEPAEEITDYEKELINLRREQKAIKTVLEREQAEKEMAARQAAADKFRTAMQKIDVELEKEGYVGFSYMQDSVAKEVQRLLQEDEGNYVIDNEEGWKKIYKEKFYPEVESKFAESLKKKLVDDKKALKSDAKLGNTPGKAPAKPKSNEEVTPEEAKERYLKSRRAMGI